MQNYTDAELLALLDDLESDCVERKESFRGNQEASARAVVRMVVPAGRRRPGGP